MPPLDVLQPTFMLLPDFTYLSDGPLTLGSIIRRSEETKRPDPKRLLNKGTLSAPSETGKQIFEPWRWNSEEEHSRNAGVFAEVAMLTGLGGRVEGDKDRVDRLDIRCDKIVQETFSPDDAYILRAIDDPTIQAILKRARRPPVFLVTGIMVAYDASITVERSRGAGTNNKLEADATQLGVPLSVGGEIGSTNKLSSKLENVPTRPFILAYQLRRIRRRVFRDSVDDAEENKWALFDDTRMGGGALVDDCEVEILTPDTIWED
jgi:hypothetical protein